MKKLLCIGMFVGLFGSAVFAQDIRAEYRRQFEAYRQQQQQAFDAYKQQQQEEFRARTGGRTCVLPEVERSDR